MCSSARGIPKTTTGRGVQPHSRKLRRSVKRRSWRLHAAPSSHLHAQPPGQDGAGVVVVLEEQARQVDEVLRGQHRGAALQARRKQATLRS